MLYKVGDRVIVEYGEKIQMPTKGVVMNCHKGVYRVKLKGHWAEYYVSKPSLISLDHKYYAKRDERLEQLLDDHGL